ncbi:hypothetical protein D6851_15955 [Altericroceibacterium spongiae]|uniref:Uncharacterized protein n=1 Tax=Altericroceibacterium spongiae TaxID=2320269 RepID=A0A420EAQ6_9SPHN|nr:hypothetical protein [Altericroceibacterium spongiae]RKF17750.1 hypothetical protein D6851_15955 [Altericroceibacterium spongiae]
MFMGHFIMWELGALIVVLVGSIVAWKISKQVRLGLHLTRMTNIFEEVEQTRRTLPIGAGGGFNSLPKMRQLQADQELQQGLQYLRQFPRHEITREVAKNARLAENLGRSERYVAIANLLEWLVEMDAALNVDDFMKSYG